MNLIKNLVDIYDKLAAQDPFPDGLVPIGYTTFEAEIEIRIDENSNFLLAKKIDKGERTTLIPCSEQSESRTNQIEPHLLFDSLLYLNNCENYVTTEVHKKYTGKKEIKKYNECFMNTLKSILDKHDNEYIKIYYNYLLKNKLIDDLIKSNIFETIDETTNLIKEETELKQFVRFIIVKEDNTEINLSTNEDIIKFYQNIYMEKNSGIDGIDYNSGEKCKIGNLFPKKIRNTGDQAKLFSSNDSGFAYKGLFEDQYQAVTIGKINADKSHNALKYLIKKQGIKLNDKIILLFGTINNLNILDDDYFSYFDDEINNYDSYKELSDALKNKIYKKNEELNIDDTSYIDVVILDSLCKGRLSINYYKEFQGKQIKKFIKNVDNWYIDTLWYGYSQKKYFSFSPFNLAKITYCKESKSSSNEKVIKNTTMNLILKMINGEKINRSFVNLITNRASNPLKFEDKRNWNNIIKAACQINRKYYNDKFKKEVIPLEMENKEYEINYELGKLLAVCDLIEKSVSDEDHNHKETNAKKYFSNYMKNPMKTYALIFEKLLPYEKKLKSSYLLKERQNIINNINPNEFKLAKNLDGRALCGYDAYISEYYKKIKEKKNKEDLKNE